MGFIVVKLVFYVSLDQIVKLLYLNSVCKKLCFILFVDVVFSRICRACTICAHLRVGLPVLFRSGRGLRKDRQIKPLS